MTTKKFIALFLILAGLTVFAAMPNSTLAATGGVKELQENLGAFGGQTGLGTAGDSDLKGKVANIINVILGFLGVLAVIMIIIAGFKWMMAGGNEETVKQARDNIKNATIGLLIVLASFIIVNFAVRQLGQATGGAGGGGSGGGGGGQGATVNEPVSCFYNITSNPCGASLCVTSSTGTCSPIMGYPACGPNDAALTNTTPGTCAQNCPTCPQ